MFRTRNQLENLSKEELIDYLIGAEDISSKLSDLINRLNDFLRQYEILSSEVTVSKNCNRLPSERIVQLERNSVNNIQFHRRESLEINPVPASVGDDVLESSLCRAFSVTGHEVKPDDLQTCHHLRKKDTVIVKFKCRKQKRSILINRKNLRNKSNVLTQLNFSGRLFVSESMCHENHQLSYTCRQLKNAARFIPRGSGITPSMLNLMKEVNLRKFIMLVTLKNFLELRI